MKVLGTCRDVSALITTREDRPLELKERMTVRGHLFICSRCRSWEKQVDFMRKSIDAWKKYRE
jgi:hypothetical protein